VLASAACGVGREHTGDESGHCGKTRELGVKLFLEYGKSKATKLPRPNQRSMATSSPAATLLASAIGSWVLPISSARPALAIELLVSAVSIPAGTARRTT